MCGGNIIRKTLDPITGKERDAQAETRRQAGAREATKQSNITRKRKGAATETRKKNISKFSANIATGGARRAASTGN